MIADPTSTYREAFASDALVSEYAGHVELFPAEERVFGSMSKALAGWTVLDLGVGAGRTTRHLAGRCRRYVGIDFAPEMVAECRRAFPGVDIRQGDARDLGDFPDSHADFILFSFNGIDSLGLADRSRVLCEVRRVLKPGGQFLFSSHNLDCRPEAPRYFADFRWTPNPLRLGKRVASALVRGWRERSNYRSLLPSQKTGDGWAQLVDSGHDYRMLHFYITPDLQRRTLDAIGLPVRETLGIDGRPLTDSSSHPWVHYWAEKR